MVTNYNTPATVDPIDGSLLCKGCKDKYCVHVREGISHFCPSYSGSILQGGDPDKYMVRCEKHMGLFREEE